ncbi:MAG: hypothetical protein RIF32_15595, partial [Leptospirales bacterium]
MPAELNITPTMLLTVFGITFAIVAGRYLVMAGPTYYVFWKLLAGKLQHRRIQQKFPLNQKLWAEFGWSMATFVVFSLMALSMFFLRKAG